MMPFNSDQVHKSLKNRYKTHTTLPRLFSEHRFDIAQSFINLSLLKKAQVQDKEKQLEKQSDERLDSHERLYEVHEPLSLEQLFTRLPEDKNDIQKVVIYGRAGIGKTVLCQYLATQWAEGKLLTKFQAVFWFKLRELKQANLTSVDKEELLCTLLRQQFLTERIWRGLEIDKARQEELLEWLETTPALFILDGYDEVADNPSPLLNDFFAALDSLKVSCLVTSRPLSIERLGQQSIQFDRSLECMGFTNDNIKAFVHDYFTELNNTAAIAPLLSFLEARPSIWGTAHIPINLELIAWAWSQGQFNQELKTLSQLYQFIVQRRIEVEQKKQPEANWTTIAEKLQQAKAFLAHLAYYAMQEGTLILPGTFMRKQLQLFLKTQNVSDSKWLAKAKQLLSDCYLLGLIKSTSEGGRDNLDQNHYFIHLSFQEFLAAEFVAPRIVAFHQSELDEVTRQGLLTFVQQTKWQNYYKVMWWFVAGALRENLPALQTFFDLLLEKPRCELEVTELMLLGRCLDEAQMPAIQQREAIIAHCSLWLTRLIMQSALINTPILRELVTNLRISPYLLTGKLATQLLELMEGKFRLVAAIVVSWLGAQATTEHINQLLKLMKDESLKVNQTAAHAVGQLGPYLTTEHINQLLELMKDENLQVSQTATHAVGQLCPYLTTKHINQLLELMKDMDSLVSQGAANVVGRLGAQASAEHINQLLVLMKNKDSAVRQAAANAIGQLGAQASAEHINQLLVLIKDEDSDVRCVAARVIGQLGAQATAEHKKQLLELMRDKDNSVRWAAASAIGLLGAQPTAEHIKQLLVLMKDEHSAVRQAAAKSIGQLGAQASAEHINQLLELIKDEDSHVRWVAAKAIGQLGAQATAEHIKQLLVLMRNEDNGVRQAAANAIGQLGTQATAEHKKQLLVLMKDEDSAVRQAAANAIGQLGAQASAEHKKQLLELMRDKDNSVRWAAAKAIGQLGAQATAEHINQLLVLMKDEHSPVRQAAANAIGQLGAQATAEHKKQLLVLMKDEDSAVRQAAANAIGQLGAQASAEHINQFLVLMKDENNSIRWAAAKALSKTSTGLAKLYEALFGQEQRIMPSRLALPEPGSHVLDKTKNLNNRSSTMPHIQLLDLFKNQTAISYRDIERFVEANHSLTDEQAKQLRLEAYSLLVDAQALEEFQAYTPAEQQEAITGKIESLSLNKDVISYDNKNRLMFLLTALGHHKLMAKLLDYTGTPLDKSIPEIAGPLAPLHIATLFGHWQSVAHLHQEHSLSFSAEITIRCPLAGKEIEVPCSLLALAILAGQLDVVRYLITKAEKSLFTKTNPLFGNPLQVAIYANQLDILRYLLAFIVMAKDQELKYLLTQPAGSYPTEDGNQSITPLMLAAFLGRTELMELLLNCRPDIDINAQDSQGNTALHWVVKGNQFYSLSTLIRLNPNINLQPLNAASLTPLSLAQQFEQAARSEPEKADYHALMTLLQDAIKKQHKYSIKPPDFLKLKPENLFFQGGGTKVLAYIGAMLQLKAIFGEAYFKDKDSVLKRIGGTSGGAITAMMVALNMDLENLSFLENVKALIGHDFNPKEDKLKTALAAAGIFLDILERARQAGQSIQGLFPTRIFQNWLTDTVKGVIELKGIFTTDRLREEIAKQIKSQLAQLDLAKDYDEHLTFGELKALIGQSSSFKHLHVTVINIAATRQQIQAINSEDGQWDNVTIASAVAASCAIPFVFEPAKLYIKTTVGNKTQVQPLADQAFIDGGVLRNYYPSIFDSLKYTRPEEMIRNQSGFNPSEYNKRTLVLGLKHNLPGSSSPATRANASVAQNPQGFFANSGIVSTANMARQVLLNDIIETSGDIEQANQYRTIWLNPGDMGTLDWDAKNKKEPLSEDAKKSTKDFFYPEDCIREKIAEINKKIEQLAEESKQVIQNGRKAKIKTLFETINEPYYLHSDKIPIHKGSKTAKGIKQKLEEIEQSVNKLNQEKQRLEESLQERAPESMLATLPKR